jgi:hypothetical protein
LARMVPVFGLISGRVQRAGADSPKYSEGSCLRVYCWELRGRLLALAAFQTCRGTYGRSSAVDESLGIWSGILEQRAASTLTILVLLRRHAYPSRQTIKHSHHETSRLNRIISSSHSHLNSLRVGLDLLHILILILIVLALLITLILM